jgi:hypothetical protein
MEPAHLTDHEDIHDDARHKETHESQYRQQEQEPGNRRSPIKGRCAVGLTGAPEFLGSEELNCSDDDFLTGEGRFSVG